MLDTYTIKRKLLPFRDWLLSSKWLEKWYVLAPIATLFFIVIMTSLLPENFAFLSSRAFSLSVKILLLVLFTLLSLKAYCLREYIRKEEERYRSFRTAGAKLAEKLGFGKEPSELAKALWLGHDGLLAIGMNIVKILEPELDLPIMTGENAEILRVELLQEDKHFYGIKYHLHNTGFVVYFPDTERRYLFHGCEGIDTSAQLVVTHMKDNSLSTLWVLRNGRFDRIG